MYCTVFRIEKTVFKKSSPVGFFGILLAFLGTGFCGFFRGVFKYEWQVLNVIHIK